MAKIARVYHSLADLDQAQGISECVIVGDSLGYQGLNARSAKETLQQRTGVLEEYQAAVKATISKRRNMERLKASNNISPQRVDEALEEMEEVRTYHLESGWICVSQLRGARLSGEQVRANPSSASGGYISEPSSRTGQTQTAGCRRCYGSAGGACTIDYHVRAAAPTGTRSTPDGCGKRR